MLYNVFLITLTAAGSSLLKQLIEFHFNFQVSLFPLFSAHFESAQRGDCREKVNEVSLLTDGDYQRTMNEAAAASVVCCRVKTLGLFFSIRCPQLKQFNQNVAVFVSASSALNRLQQRKKLVTQPLSIALLIHLSS